MSTENESLECEGNCEECVGEVVLCRVWSKEFGWWKFHYCENAINCDIENGFIVIKVKQ